MLEAIKERGEVVTKFAYGDWTRAGDYGRAMSQHAIHMVQRNLTPGGDKNGADINLALDALEMAFTHSHINASSSSAATATSSPWSRSSSSTTARCSSSAGARSPAW